MGKKLEFISVVSLFIICGCTDALPGLSQKAKNPDPVNPSTTPVVCNPLGGSGGGSPSNGIKADLKYLTSDMPQYSMVADYQSHGIAVPANIYLPELFVPTRLFSAGFQTQDGTLLQNNSEEVLLEWFSLHFESEIRLTSHNQPGRYEFAILSDDGAIMSVDEGSGFTELVNNDNWHPTRLGCPSRAVSLSATSRMKMKLDYFQGPRYHIALILLWRKIPDVIHHCSHHLPDHIKMACNHPGHGHHHGGHDDSDHVDHDDGPVCWDTPDTTLPSEPLCGATGNEMWFDPAQSINSAYHAEQSYLDLLARGWSPVPAENFFMPNDGTNPCSNP